MRKRRNIRFYIESIDINIYTIEELCFYLWKNVSLLDESILNEKLCDWLEGELGMQRLAFHLREKLKDAESIAELVLPVFREVRYLNAAEMYAVKEQIGKLEVQTGGYPQEDPCGSAGQLRHVFRGDQPLPSDPAKPQSGENRASVLCRRTEQYGGGVRKDVPVPRGRRLSVAVL